MGTIDQTKWESFKTTETDMDFLYNLLLENEKPMTVKELSKALISESIAKDTKEVEKAENQQAECYKPKNHYNKGDVITFPLLNYEKGIVCELRKGISADTLDFSVIKVKMNDGITKEFASDLENHKLNRTEQDKLNRDAFDPKFVYSQYGKKISKTIFAELSKNEDLFCIGGFWFPSALLATVNPGYLNLAEAVLEMDEGNPVSTKLILEQIDYPKDSNEELTEFSFNYAMIHDDRFDEVGPLGTILWTLHLLKPEDVRKTPMTLKYSAIPQIEISDEEADAIDQLGIQDELEIRSNRSNNENGQSSFEYCLSYPHWKAGTLPLLDEAANIFPKANETDNIVFTFIDEKSHNSFQGWVIPSKHYVSGLKQWYRTNNIIPGSIFRISRRLEEDESNDIILSIIPPRGTKEWIRTVKFDEKNHIHFETRQQTITAEIDDRMGIFVENLPQLDILWETNNRPESNPKKQIDLIFNELVQENPQGIVHFEELYAVMNILRRIPPKVLFGLLSEDKNIVKLDNYHFRINDKIES